MEIILMERIPKLGQMGDVVKVRAGFARNYLIPQGKAVRASQQALDNFEKRRAQLETVNLERRQDAEEMAKRIDGRSVVILRQASETKQLYGSVSGRDIVEAFVSDGLTLDRRQVQLDQSLKTVGIHSVVIALHPEVEVAVTVNIARSQEEADIQAGKAAPPVEEDEPNPEDDLDGDPRLDGFADAIEAQMAHD